MALTVQTNNAAVTALKHLNTNNINMTKSLERLSSGFRVNSAADDAAGYAIASKLDAQNARLKAATQNVSQAQAMVKMADAGVNEIQNMLVRIETLAIQASSANNGGELTKLNAERVKLESQINKIANSTNYNGLNLLNGLNANSAAVSGTAATLAASGTAGTGANSPGTTTLAVAGTALFSNAANFTVSVSAAGAVTAVTSDVALLSAADGTTLAAAGNVTASLAALGITLTATAGATPTAGTFTFAATAGTAAVAAGQTAYTAALAFQAGSDNNVDNQVNVDLTNSYTTASLYAAYTGTATADLLSQANAQNYIDKAGAALNQLVTQRADLGATQNQLSFVAANLSTSIEQATASVSSIRDADMAMEMASFTKNQILVQASTSMLAQANQAAQNVLSLFR